ncbi:MAG TPA: 16S rRNA (uracil(1498)-N(3))-methyltransferase [Beutenbergiaceae bacterium]|nr:16S rRNA (uracil(1498)-N(3))-methyltransferase [Beutenbergiaceae bacterium]
MSRPVFLVPAATLTGRRVGDQVAVTGSEARHAIRARRLRPGERVDLVDGSGGRGTAEITDLDAVTDTLRAQLMQFTIEPAPEVDLALVQALGKGGRDELAVEMSTEVGAGQITPWQSARAVSRWRGAKVDGGRQRWQQIATAAAKQARRSHFPEVQPLVVGDDLVDVVTRACAQGEVVLILHEEAATPIGEVRLQGAHRISVVVGPEGGLTPDEVTALRAAGGQPVRLGPHVLRTSTAGPVALALVADHLGHWARD